MCERLRLADAEIDRGEGLEFDEHTTKNLAKERGMKRLAESRPIAATLTDVTAHAECTVALAP